MNGPALSLIAMAVVMTAYLRFIGYGKTEMEIFIDYWPGWVVVIFGLFSGLAMVRMTTENIKSAITAATQRHKLVRRLTLAWACLLITWATWRTFGDKPPEVPEHTAVALGIVVGILATVIGLYKWSRMKEEENRSEQDGRTE